MPPVSAQQRLELEDLYQRLKMNFEKSNHDVALKKRLRKDDQPQLGFDNVNVVIPGQSLLSLNPILKLCLRPIQSSARP